MLLDHRFAIEFPSPELLKASVLDFHCFEQVVLDSLATIHKALPGPANTIRFTLDSNNVIPWMGIGGFSDPTQNGKITISLHPNFKEPLTPNIIKWLPGTLAHEVHHSVRIQIGPGFGKTLLEELITEGLADSFAHTLYPGMVHPWTNALNSNQEYELWQQIQPFLNNLDLQYELYGKWFFGGDGIPNAAGYTIGYRIVQNYLNRHPIMSAAELVREEAKTILKASDYAFRDAEPVTPPNCSEQE